jgi:UDP-N-acetylmuramate--alanine ligase
VIFRGAAEISAGLEPARPARAIPAGQRVHVVGAGGSAAAPAALLGHLAGAVVTGCDASGTSTYTLPLEDAGIPLAWENSPEHVVRDGVVQVDRLAVTKALTAVAPNHPELVAARAHGIPVTSVQQLIADAAATRGSRLVGVAGTHGKSTTTGWVVHLLTEAGLDPTGFVGALMPAELAGGPHSSTVRVGSGDLFVVEADEYAGNFDPYQPVFGVLLNADWDHPDVFASRADVVTAFATWIRAFDGRGAVPTLVANAADEGVREVLGLLRDWAGRLVVTTVTEDAAADLAAERRSLEVTYASAAGPAAAVVGRWSIGPDGTSCLEIAGLGAGEAVVQVGLRLPGRHNGDNGLAAAALASAAGAATSAIQAGLASYAGVGRRMEVKAEIGGVVIVDDYGHHPTAMRATFAAVAQRYPGRRLWAVYEPLTYHRTAAMIEPFAEILEQADRVVIADIFPVRDPDTTITSAAELAEAVNRRGRTPAWAPGSVQATADWLAPRVEPGDVVLVMGGGKSYVIAERLAVHLRKDAM